MSRGFQSLQAWVDATAQAHPIRIAVRSSVTSVTYAEMRCAALSLAAKLLAHGAQADTLVALYAHRSVEMVIAMVGIFIASFFIPGLYEITNLAIAGFGTVLFVGMAFVDFYTMPRMYRDDQYLSGALGMYLTYINLFVFVLRLIIALQGGGRRD